MLKRERIDCKVLYSHITAIKTVRQHWHQPYSIRLLNLQSLEVHRLLVVNSRSIINDQTTNIQIA